MFLLEELLYRLLELLLFWLRRTERELLLTVFEEFRRCTVLEFLLTVDLLLELFENVVPFLLARLPRLVNDEPLLLKALLYAVLLPYL